MIISYSQMDQNYSKKNAIRFKLMCLYEGTELCAPMYMPLLINVTALLPGFLSM